MEKKIVWYASGGHTIKCGPFSSQIEAWKAMILTKKEQERQQSIHPFNTKVWPEYENE